MSRRRRAGTDEQGFATVEFIVAFPLVLLLVWIGFQLVFVFFANRVALAAAEEGARAARSYTGSAAAGDARAHKFLTELGSGVLVEPTVRAYRTPERAGVVVEGRAQQLVPGLSMVLRVHRAADGPVERFRGDVPGFVNSEVSSGGNSSVETR
jgi:Flp pilus assembly protein TadG